MTDPIVSKDGLAVEKERTAPPPDDARKPESPSDLTTGSWRYAVKQAWAEFRRDECTDLAAALTYYAILSMFPALLAMVALLGIFGQGASTTADVARTGGAHRAAGRRRPIATTDHPDDRDPRGWICLRVRRGGRGVERFRLSARCAAR